MADYDHVDGAKVAGSAICNCGNRVEFKSNLVTATKCSARDKDGKVCGIIVKNRNYQSNRKVEFLDSKTAKKGGSIP